MKSSHILLVGSILLAGVAAIACNPVPDVNGDLSESGADTAEKKKDVAPPLSSPTSGGATPSTTSTTESAPLADASAPLATTDAFTGAAAFAQITPLTDTSNHHLGNTETGRDCLSCHGENNGAPTFALGGSVRETGGQPDGATGVQVRIVGPDGKELALVGTDSEGNFWLTGSTTIPAGSFVGIRDGATEKKMSGAIGAGSCNTAGCHDATRPIFLNPGP